MNPLPMNPTPSLARHGMNYSAPPIMTAASTRLSVMMFLEYLIWGSWLPLLALYLGDVLGLHRRRRSAGSSRRRPSPACSGSYFGGQIADRLMSTEKLLARAAPDRRHRDVRAGVPDVVLAVLHRHAGLSAGLHADDVADQRDLLPSHLERANGVRQAPAVGHDRLDRRELAVRVHPRRQDRPGSSRRAVAASSPSPASRRSRWPRFR